MSPEAGVTHVFTVKDVAGTNKYGFNPPRDQSGLRPYTLSLFPTILPRQLTMGELTQAEFPVEVAQTNHESNWQAGLGGINHRTHPFRLASGLKIDASGNEELLRLFRKRNYANAIDTEPANGEFVPSGFATTGDQFWYWSAQNPVRWNFTDKNWDFKTVPTGYDSASVARNVVPYKGHFYVPRWADDVGSANNYVFADRPSPYFYKAATDTSWTASTLATTNPDAFKYLAVANGSFWGAVPATYTDPTRETAEVLDTSETDISVDAAGHGFGPGSVIRIDNELILVVAEDGNQILTTVVRGYRGTAAASHGSGTPIYDVIVTTNAIHSTLDPTNTGSWGGQTLIGDASSPITALLGSDTDLIICKTDGIYRLASDGKVTELFPELRNQIHPDNFKGSILWNNRVLAPLGAGGLLEFDLLTFERRNISPKLSMPERTEYHGRIVALAGESDNVYALIHESGNTRYHVMKAEWLNINGVIDYRWHSMGIVRYATGTDDDHAALYIGSLEGNAGGSIHHRLWIGIESTAATGIASNLYPFWIPLSSTDVDPDYDDSQDEDTTIDTDASLDTTETLIAVDGDPTGNIAVNDVVKIESELMLVTAIAATPTITATRGYFGSTAATHNTNQDIFIYRVAEAVTTVSDNNLPNVDKREQKIVFTSKKLGSTRGTDHQIVMQYRVDGGSWTYVTGSASSSTLTTSPQTLSFAAGITGKLLELRSLAFLGSTTTTSPELLAFTVTSQLRADAVEVIPMLALLQDGERLLNGAGRDSQVQDRLAQVKTWRDQTAEVTVDVDDNPNTPTTYTCVFLTETFTITQLTRRRGRRPSYLVKGLMANVS